MLLLNVVSNIIFRLVSDKGILVFNVMVALILIGSTTLSLQNNQKDT